MARTLHRDSPPAVPAARRRVTEWLHAFSDASGSGARFLEHTYGADVPHPLARLRLFRTALHAYLERHGDDEVLVARAPGRVNVMGRHIDHQGGTCNLIAIDRDIVLVVGGRADRRVLMHNADAAQFPDADFCLNELVEPIGDMAWAEFVDTEAARAVARQWAGNWSLYVRAALARVQARFPDRHLRGMNIAAAGDIPVAAGLSSSSALVVATAEAAMALNGLTVEPAEFVEMCGEGEWYVGTRGGAADHAAMKFARTGRVVRLGFLPFKMLDTAPFPPEHLLLIANSGQKAKKTEGARDVFNQRVACYHIGREMLKRAHPDLAERCRQLRDWNAEALGLSQDGLYRSLLRLPERMCREQVREAIPAEVGDRVLSTHGDGVGDYPVRGVVLFGLSECARARSCGDALHRGDAAAFGRLMSASHDGDRVARWTTDRDFEPYGADCSDAMLEWLAEQLGAGSPEADLARVPGAYACSTPFIDRLADVALSVPGVAGAQLAGAGLGGCMMVLVHRDACSEAQSALAERAYGPEGVEPETFACRAVSGSGLVEI